MDRKLAIGLAAALALATTEPAVEIHRIRREPEPDDFPPIFLDKHRSHPTSPRQRGGR